MTWVCPYGLRRVLPQPALFLTFKVAALILRFCQLGRFVVVLCCVVVFVFATGFPPLGLCVDVSLSFLGLCNVSVTPRKLFHNIIAKYRIRSTNVYKPHLPNHTSLRLLVCAVYKPRWTNQTSLRFFEFPLFVTM